MAGDADSASTSLLEMRQNTTLPINEHIAGSPYSNLDDLADSHGGSRHPATISDPLAVGRPPRVRNNGLIAWYGHHEDDVEAAAAVAVDENEDKENGKAAGSSRTRHRSSSRGHHGSDHRSAPLAVNNKGSNYLPDLFGGTGRQLHLKELFVENAQRLNDTIVDLANTQRLSRTVRHNRQRAAAEEEDDQDDHGLRRKSRQPLPHRNQTTAAQDPLNSHIPHAHFRSYPRTTSPNSYFRYHPYNTPHFTAATQNIMADAISPSVVGATNVRFVTTTERDVRDRQVTDALNIISQSMEPPVHNVDRYKDWLLEKLRIDTLDEQHQTAIYRVSNFMMGSPLMIFRAFWHYVVMQIHLVYNLGLLYATFYSTPPLMAFVIGLTLFWMKVVYELYRDIMHRDDPLYSSNVPKEMSIAAAISASMGFVLNMKAQEGDLTDAWWRGED